VSEPSDTVKELQVLAPLLGVLVGAMLSGFGQLLKAWLERRRIIAAALADLLEVRHRFVSLDTICTTLAQKVHLDPALLPELRNQLETALPIDPELDARFASAVSALAGIDPLLAYYLRSRQAIPNVISTMRTRALAAGTGAADLERAESLIRGKIISNLTTAVLRLAKARSWWTFFSVRTLIAKSAQVPIEADELLSELTGTRTVAHPKKFGT
jgi:hypothetical protein